jgi:hypothetical protein
MKSDLIFKNVYELNMKVGLAPKHGYCHARPKNYLAESILTFLCFPPTAIVAIVFAIKVNFHFAYDSASKNNSS